jgi:hypothetical protein
VTPPRPPAIGVLPPAKGGRPRAEASTTVCTWLPARDYDRLVRLAQAHEQSVSALVRTLLRTRLPRTGP